MRCHRFAKALADLCRPCACGAPRLARRPGPLSQSNVACGQTLPRALRLADLRDCSAACEHLVSSPCRSPVETAQNSQGAVERTSDVGTQTVYASSCRTAP